MQVYALELEDIFEEEYALIAIHSALEDYKLAYLINKNLNTHFYKAKKNLEFVRQKEIAFFSLYTYKSLEDDFSWFLIANSFSRENQALSNTFLLDSETKTFLIPELKKVDFFIKICGDVQEQFINKTIKTIRNIDPVITAYAINKNNLKSKDFLIF